MDGAVAAPLNGAVGALASNTTNLTTYNVGTLVDYVKEVLSVTLGADRDELTQFGSLFSEEYYDETAAKLTRYAQESMVAIYVVKDLQERKSELLEDGM